MTTAAMRTVVIAGGSIAGLSSARELRRAGFDGSIEMIDADQHAPYRRPAVSKAILTGHNEPADIAIGVPAELEVTVHGGVTLRALDVAGKLLHGDAGGTPVRFGYDGLVIATGSAARPWRPPAGLDGVHSLRSVADGMALRAALATAGHAVIVGGGFIGLEVASAARSMGVNVTVVEAAPVPLGHVLGAGLGEHLARVHRDHGVQMRCGVTVTGWHGQERVESIVLSDGAEIEAGLVLACVGSQPAVGWLQGSGLDLGDGVRCDRNCVAAGADQVVAAGDVASWLNPCFGARMRVEHWANAIEQGTFAARALLGQAAPAGFSSVPYFWSEQYGIRLQSVGVCVGHDETLLLRHCGQTMVVGYGRAGRVIGVAGYDAGTAVGRVSGQKSGVLGYRKHIEQGASLAALAERAPVSTP
ncbi:MAG TPA: FAD-dependent oxidoreductase [Streptosporangiaceae bacterium]|jgi:NADPH-dependent 2,4-dienoyl-CoA reductase/sulfur reductase-like enzyme|nr:FAD-dependent oxidoreductase [Streptosporangiaceae bacterium]